MHTCPTMYLKQFNQKKRNIINFKFHFIIYHDLNATVFSERFPTIKYFDEVQHGAECMLSRITLCL